jgi:hypothetical protein
MSKGSNVEVKPREVGPKVEADISAEVKTQGEGTVSSILKADGRGKGEAPALAAAFAVTLISSRSRHLNQFAKT